MICVDVVIYSIICDTQKARCVWIVVCLCIYTEFVEHGDLVNVDVPLLSEF